MSLESMKQRLTYLGGASQQNRMILQKRRTMLSAIKNSYQGARFSKYIDKQLQTEEFRGLFNPVTHNMDYDTKMISTEFKNELEVGSIFCWRNTGEYWIVYARDLTELAYFRGECRKCNYKIQWVDKNQEVQEALVSIIGPTPSTMRTSSSMQAAVAEDFPNNVIKVLVADTDINRGFFNKYGEFVLKGISYQVNNIDNLSMSGIIQLNCKQHYTNLIDDDVENNLRNAWNVQPVISEEHESMTEYGIIGDKFIQPIYEYEYSALGSGGIWYIKENYEDYPARHLPVVFIENDHSSNPIHLKWDYGLKGSFTLVYKTPDIRYEKYIVVESLM